jgi:nucleotidyltransferase/DNA polymerase involved in DNA repair
MHSFPRAIAHIDADCFFASVELLDFPHLKGKPVLVCSRTDRRGIVLAATYEARPFGIRAGTPIFKAVEACPQAHILQSHFHKYTRVSHELMQILGSFSPDLEVSSVDEAYMDLTSTAELLKRVFAVDGWACPSCGERMRSLPTTNGESGCCAAGVHPISRSMARAGGPTRARRRGRRAELCPRTDQGRIPSTGRRRNVAKRACGEGAGWCRLLACGSHQRVHVAYPHPHHADRATPPPAPGGVR